MRQLVHAGATESSRRTKSVAVNFSWRALLEKLFPEKTVPCVASLTRNGLRATEYMLSRDSAPSTTALINLLRSPVGQAVLDALLDGVEWRDAERRLIEISELQNQVELKRRELTRALDGPRQ